MQNSSIIFSAAGGTPKVPRSAISLPRDLSSRYYFPSCGEIWPRPTRPYSFRRSGMISPLPA